MAKCSEAADGVARESVRSRGKPARSPGRPSRRDGSAAIPAGFDVAAHCGVPTTQLIGAQDQRWRYVEAACFGGFEHEHKFEIWLELELERKWKFWKHSRRIRRATSLAQSIDLVIDSFKSRHQ
jgi:hypothetical protein